MPKSSSKCFAASVLPIRVRQARSRRWAASRASCGRLRPGRLELSEAALLRERASELETRTAEAEERTRQAEQGAAEAELSRGATRPGWARRLRRRLVQA
jgi:hypothetical protein